MDKLLSIIVPSYNMEKYLPKCLGSLIVDDAELLQKLDVIVVNDGSKDRTSEIAHDFERRYPSVFRVIDKPNGNYGSCINAALPVALGMFVRILDADDTFDTVAFAEYLKALATMSPDTDLVINDYVTVDVSGAERGMATNMLPIDRAFGLKELVAAKSRVTMYGVAHRTKLLKDIGYTQLEGISYTDTEWFYLPVAYAKKIHYVPRPVYLYLVGRMGQTMEHSTWVKNLWMMGKIFSRMRNQYDECALNEVARLYLESQLQRMFSLVLMLHCEEDKSSNIVAYAGAVKPLIAKYPFLSRFLRDPVVFKRSPFPFHYFAFAVEHSFLARPVVALVVWYSQRRRRK